VVCENIQDPGNLGTLMRSAAAFGFIDFMVISGVDPYSPKVIKASEGSFFQINIIEVDLAGALKLTSSSFRLMTHPHQEKPKVVTTPLSIWLGNEGNGLSKEALDHADGLYQIKTKHVES
jgi:TrmH family RNA methyltransferase